MEQGSTVLVIGGGASGMAAALAAAEKGGCRVVLLERMDRIGKKLLATGNGRCNLTNRNAAPEFYHTAEPACLEAMLAEYPVQNVLDFFERQGLLCDTQQDGKVYPYSYQASMVLDVLRAALERAGVLTECSAAVKHVEKKKGHFTVFTENGKKFTAEKVILAAGGQAAPQFGTDGAGFRLAHNFGHHTTVIYPCLVPIRCRAFASGLKGTRVNAALSLLEDGKCLKTEKGELQLAEYGVSGIPAMQLSCLLGGRTRGMQISIDFFPEMSFPELRTMIAGRCTCGSFPTLETLLLGLISKKIGYAVLKSCGFAPLSMQSAGLTRAQQNALCAALKGWRFDVEGTLSWGQAQTTGGGVPLSEVDPATCESRLCRGLYLAGELLDAAGDCGGFNLQWAWATGICAGYAAAE